MRINVGALIGKHISIATWSLPEAAADVNESPGTVLLIVGARTAGGVSGFSVALDGPLTACVVSNGTGVRRLDAGCSRMDWTVYRIRSKGTDVRRLDTMCSPVRRNVLVSTRDILFLRWHATTWLVSSPPQVKQYSTRWTVACEDCLFKTFVTILGVVVCVAWYFTTCVFVVCDVESLVPMQRVCGATACVSMLRDCWCPRWAVAQPVKIIQVIVLRVFVSAQTDMVTYFRSWFTWYAVYSHTIFTTDAIVDICVGLRIPQSGFLWQSSISFHNQTSFRAEHLCLQGTHHCFLPVYFLSYLDYCFLYRLQCLCVDRINSVKPVIHLFEWLCDATHINLLLRWCHIS